MKENFYLSLSHCSSLTTTIHSNLMFVQETPTIYKEFSHAFSQLSRKMLRLGKYYLKMQQLNFPKIRELSHDHSAGSIQGGIRTSVTPRSKSFHGTKWYNGFNLQHSLIISSCTRLPFSANRCRNAFLPAEWHRHRDKIKCLFTRGNLKGRKSTPRQLRNTCTFSTCSPVLFKSSVIAGLLFKTQK